MNINNVIIKGIVSVFVTGAFVFWMAGTATYWPGWLFVLITAVRFIAGVVIFRDRPELIQERTRPGPGTVWWDKVFYAFYSPLFIAVLVIGCLDGGRFHWSGSMSVWWIATGACVHILSHILVIWSMQVNDFFSSMVRIQKERSHKVVDSGPYQYVRHPGYFAASMMALSLALVLASWYAILPAIGVVLSLVIRTTLEDRTLRSELDGYENYTERVPYRILPGLW